MAQMSFIFFGAQTSNFSTIMVYKISKDYFARWQ